MRQLLSVLLASSTLVACAGGSTASADWTLVWEDEFNGPANALPADSNWTFDIGTDWGNAQLEYDTNRPENVSLDGAGNLRIVARQEPWLGRNYTSGRIKTKVKQEFQYGRFEARIRQPTGRGLWPAFWMLGSNIDVVGWPQTGEIDVMEYRGQEPTITHGSIHGPGYSGGNAITRRYFIPSGRLDTAFHVYSAEWSANQIRFYVDDQVFHVVNKGEQTGAWVFDQPFFILLNLAVGGGFVGAPDGSTTFPQTMLIDYVRVYQKAP
ncbi:MAG: family 16 glycosylhydrolase [Gemmatimonadaceae bacterium]